MKNSDLAIVMMKDLKVSLCSEDVVVRIHFWGEMPLVETDFALVVLDNHCV